MNLPLIILEETPDPLFRVVYQDATLGDCWAMKAMANAEALFNLDRGPVGLVQVRDSFRTEVDPEILKKLEAACVVEEKLNRGGL